MTRRRVIIRPAAELDIATTALWYHGQRPGLADEFEAEVRDAIERAAASPRRCERLRRSPEIRLVLTRRFPYCVYFAVRRDAIVVFRVLHVARDPRHWKGGS